MGVPLLADEVEVSTVIDCRASSLYTGVGVHIQSARVKHPGDCSLSLMCSESDGSSGVARN